jgi:hypothetical protein
VIAAALGAAGLGLLALALADVEKPVMLLGAATSLTVAAGALGYARANANKRFRAALDAYADGQIAREWQLRNRAGEGVFETSPGR